MSSQLNAEQLKEKALAAVSLAMAKGAETATVLTQWQQGQKVSVRSSEVEELSQSESLSVEIVVSQDHRRASVHTSDLSLKSLASMVDHAIALCKYTDRDPFYSLPDADLLAKSSDLEDLDLLDPSIEGISTPRRIEMVRDLEKQLLAQDPRLKSNGAGISSARGISVLANSLGFCEFESESMIRLQVAGFADDEVADGDLNSGRKQSGGRSSNANHYEDLEDSSLIAQEAAHNILRKLGARKPKTGTFPVYYEPKIARSLWGHLASACTGSAIFRNQSYLADRLLSQVTVPNLSIRDMPRIRRGSGSRCFDNEGVVSKNTDLVRNGVLQTYLLSTYSANKLGMKTTGHAGGISNLCIEPGSLDEAEMLKAMGTGLWLTTLLGQGTNLNSGDYSHGALGLWVEEGEVAYPVMEFTINGNLDSMFQNITHIGSNVDLRSSIRTPGLVIGEMTLSGT